MSTSYDVSSDPRFQRIFADRILKNLTETSFPSNEEQPKNVLQIGTSFGGALDVYADQSKQLFLQGKLSLAVGDDLDIFGGQFNLPRRSGEGDDRYRVRLKALFSPRKVVKTYIEETANTLIQSNPKVTIFEPWQFIMKFDDPQWSFDIDDSHYWSPDYWSSGILVIRSGISPTIQNAVEGLVAIGVKVLYEQFDYSHAGSYGFSIEGPSYEIETIYSLTPIGTSFWFDLDVPGNFDDPEYSYDLSDFARGLSNQNEYQHNLETVSLISQSSSYYLVGDSSTTSILTLNLVPGSWYNQSQTFTLYDTIVFSDGVLSEFNGEVLSGTNDILTFYDLVSTVDVFGIQDDLWYYDSCSSKREYSHSILDSVTFSDATSDLSGFITFSSGYLFGDRIVARELDTITLNNPLQRKLDQVVLAQSLESSSTARILYLNTLTGTSLQGSSLQNGDLIGSVGSPPFIQTTSLNAPLYKEASFNNGPCIHFDKVAQNLVCSDSSTLAEFLGTTGLTIAMSHKPVLDGEAGVYWSIDYASQPMVQYGVTSQGLQQRSLKVAPSNSAPVTTLTSASNVSDGTIVEIVVINWASGTAVVYRNGVQIISGSVGSPLSADTPVRIQLGSSVWNTEFFLKEMLIYKRPYVVGEVTQLTNELAVRGAIVLA